MFDHWDNFYLMIGSAAGALIGLLFVVATLTGGLGRERVLKGSTLYMTPNVFHFAVVLVSSAITAVPHLDVRANCTAAMRQSCLTGVTSGVTDARRA